MTTEKTWAPLSHPPLGVIPLWDGRGGRRCPPRRASRGSGSGPSASSLRGLPDRHRRVFERPVPAALLHMDVWAENLLAGPGGRLTGLIDWDRALWGDPE